MLLFQFNHPRDTNAKRLRDIPVDILQIIFEQLPIQDLMNATKSYDATIEELAYWAFRHGKSYKQFVVCDTAYTYWSHGSKFAEDEVSIQIKDYSTTMDFFKRFGHMIKYFHMDYTGVRLYSATNVSSNQMKHMITAIPNDCANVTHFEMTCDGSMHYDLMMPSEMVNVIVLRFTRCHFHGGYYINLNKHFPNVRSLQFEMTSTIYDGLLDYQFPNVIEFKFNFLNKGFDNYQLQRMFQKNQQIKSIYVGNCTLDFLHNLATHLPQLERFELNEIKSSQFDGMIVGHFPLVKKFILQLIDQNWSMRHVNYVPMTFTDQLNELQLIWDCTRFSDEWTQFIEDNVAIEMFSIRFMRGQCSNFAHLPDLRMPNLVHFTVQGIDLTDDNELDKFVEKIQQIQRWKRLETITFADIPYHHTNLLRHKFNLDWEIDEFRYKRSNALIDVVLRK